MSKLKDTIAPPDIRTNFSPIDFHWNLTKTIIDPLIGKTLKGGDIKLFVDRGFKDGIYNLAIVQNFEQENEEIIFELNSFSEADSIDGKYETLKKFVEENNVEK